MATDLRTIATAQAKEELFAYRMYTALADRSKDESSKNVMLKLAEQERSHVDVWLGVLHAHERSIRIPAIKYWLLVTASRLLGPAFTIRWFERGEDKAIDAYEQLLSDGQLAAYQRTAVQKMLEEEQEHERSSWPPTASSRCASAGPPRF